MGWSFCVRVWTVVGPWDTGHADAIRLAKEVALFSASIILVTIRAGPGHRVWGHETEFAGVRGSRYS